MRNAKWHSLFGIETYIHKVKHRLTIRDSNHIPIYPREFKICVHTKTYVNIHSTLLIISKNENKMFLNREMKMRVHPRNGILFSDKEE